MKIVVLSTDTEQYLLQWWLPHSAKKFDFGVVVDFGWGDDGDNTYELYRKFVPHWRYYKVTQTEVSNFLWDVVLTKIEKDLAAEFPGSWITTLNATEFVIGDMNSLEKHGPNSQVLIPCHLMNDALENENVEPDPNISLLKQRHHGIHYSNDFPHPSQGKTYKLLESQFSGDLGGFHNFRFMRSIHNFSMDYITSSMYSIGRHYWNPNSYSDKLAICHYNLSPLTETFIKRKTQIKRRLTQSDFAANRGIHHKRATPENVMITKRFYDQLTVDLFDEIKTLEDIK